MASSAARRSGRPAHRHRATGLNLAGAHGLLARSGDRVGLISAGLRDSTQVNPGVGDLCLDELASTQSTIELERFANDDDRLLGAEEILDDDLLVLEDLVVLEEPPHFTHEVRRELRFVGVVGKGRIANAHRHDLVVNPLRIAGSAGASATALLNASLASCQCPAASA